MGIGYDSIPECLDFCLGQYERFKIPVIKEIEEVIEVGIASTLIYVDGVDPYALFNGVSDVDMTDEWSRYTYEVSDYNRYYEVSPENLETFLHIPGQSEESFNSILSQPGLKAHAWVGVEISAVLDGDWGMGETCMDRISVPAREALWDLCRKNGKVNEEMCRAYFELASWAALAWIVGPPSRVFRAQHHDVFAIAMSCGEAILVDGSVISPLDYRKHNRPPESCYRCGISAWCVELTSELGGTKYICEHCLSEGMPLMGYATCGSKRCMLNQCPHHPYHHLGAAGLGVTRRNHGQLGSVARGETVTRIGGSQKQALPAR